MPWILRRAHHLLLAWAGTTLLAQQPPGPPDFGPPGGPGPGGGPMATDVEVVGRFDADGSGRLDAAERKVAREWLASNRPQRGPRGPGGRSPGGPPDGPDAPAAPAADAKGATVTREGVTLHADRDVFDADVVRTIFVDFVDAGWFEDLTAFHRTDVRVPATVTIDGETFRDVGTAFRGNTSFAMVRGKKKSWDLEFDFVHDEQAWRGVRNLDLINCHGDPSFVREMLHGWVATQFLPAQRVALVRLVVDGEDFGVFAAVQQFDKEFLRDHFGTRQGDRWKVPPDFGGDGGLRWLGDDPEAYRQNYQLKSAENERAWASLVDLCAVLERTATADLPRILPQHLDVDGALWFLAVDNALADDDGYFSRASDYLLYRDPSGRFHVVPRDNNEILGDGTRRGPRGGAGGPGGQRGPGGPGERGGPGGPGAVGRRGPGGGTAATPLAGAERADRPLLRRLLEVPAWRARYLANLRTLATTVLADGVVASRLAQWRDVIEPIARGDVHAPFAADAFARSFAEAENGVPAPGSLRAVIAARRRAILDDAALAGEVPTLDQLELRSRGTAAGHVLHVSCRSDAARVTIHWRQQPFGAFTELAMLDDGTHGDGSAGDGVFGAELPPIGSGQTCHLWVEAAAASHQVTCLPAAGGARPTTWVAPQ